MGNSYASTPRVRKASGIRTVNSYKLPFMHISETLYNLCPTFPVSISQWNFGKCTDSSSRPHIKSYACRLTEPTFRAEITTSEKFQFHI